MARQAQALRVTIGFAASDRGEGVAYASLGARGAGSPVRVGFRCRVQPALLGRDVAYAALTAVADELQARGIERVILTLDDDRLPAELAERRSLPSALVVPYVKLGCALNRFRDAKVESSHDLTARARAEASFLVAA